MTRLGGMIHVAYSYHVVHHVVCFPPEVARVSFEFDLETHLVWHCLTVDDMFTCLLRPVLADSWLGSKGHLSPLAAPKKKPLASIGRFHHVSPRRWPWLVDLDLTENSWLVHTSCGVRRHILPAHEKISFCVGMMDCMSLSGHRVPNIRMVYHHFEWP